MLTHDQVTERLKDLGAQKAHLREQMQHLQREGERLNQRAAQVRNALLANEAQGRIVASLLQESARSEEFDQQPAVAPGAVNGQQ
jgi:hypothetical protein